MKDQKIRRGILCVIIAVAIQTIGGLYSTYLGYSSFLSSYKDLSEYGTASAQIPLTSLFGVSLMWTAALIVFTYFVVQDLKRGKGWAWIGALSVLLVTAPSFALPVSVFGMISLIDEEVRRDFLTQLNI